MAHLGIETSLSHSTENRLSAETLDAGNEPEWDAFLEQTPAGHPVQTSTWARAKAVAGWRSVTIVIRKMGEIVAGGQILVWPVPVIPALGSIGYITKGPVVAPGHEAGVVAFLRRLESLARNRGVLYCAVQPPENSTWDSDLLLRNGYQPSRLELAPIATVRIDLAADNEVLLGRMKSKTRYNIRHGLRRGIQVREGNDKDLKIFYRLLESTAGRQNFTPDSSRYFSRLCHEFGPRLKLFFAEKEGQALSAALIIRHRDTAYYKRGAWSGGSGRDHPNEVMHWQIMRWARAQGLRYYDLEGIEPTLVRHMTKRRGALPRTVDQVSSFKLGFGGEALLYPRCYECTYSKLFKFVYHFCGKEKGMLWAKEKFKRLR